MPSKVSVLTNRQLLMSFAKEPSSKGPTFRLLMTTSMAAYYLLIQFFSRFFYIWTFLCFHLQKDLAKDLKGELSGSILTTCEMLTYATGEFLAVQMHEAMAGIGCDEAAMTEILMSRTNQEIEDTRNFYSNSTSTIKTIRSTFFRILFTFLTVYGHSLISDIQSETKGSEQDLLVLLAQVRLF